MHNFNPLLPLERELGKQIYQALQGPVVETILKSAKDGSSDGYWRSRMEGHCMKVDQEILPDFYALCQDVKKRLNFKDAVDFYVTGDSTLNAFSVAAATRAGSSVRMPASKLRLRGRSTCFWMRFTPSLT